MRVESKLLFGFALITTVIDGNICIAQEATKFCEPVRGQSELTVTGGYVSKYYPHIKLDEIVNIAKIDAKDDAKALAIIEAADLQCAENCVKSGPVQLGDITDENWIVLSSGDGTLNPSECAKAVLDGGFFNGASRPQEEALDACKKHVFYYFANVQGDFTIPYTQYCATEEKPKDTPKDGPAKK